MSSIVGLATLNNEAEGEALIIGLKLALSIF